MGGTGESMMGDTNRGSSVAGGNTGVVAFNGIMLVHGDKVEEMETWPMAA